MTSPGSDPSWQPSEVDQQPQADDGKYQQHGERQRPDGWS
jgi:hypothetical protein